MNKIIAFLISVSMYSAVPVSNKPIRTKENNDIVPENIKPVPLSIEMKKKIKAFVEERAKNSKKLADQELVDALESVPLPLRGELELLMTKNLINPEQKAAMIMQGSQYKAIFGDNDLLMII